MSDWKKEAMSAEGCWCESCEQLRAENERLKAELAEAKKDAEIFQWLQDNHVRAQAFFWNYQSRPQRRKAIIEAMKGK